MTFAVIFGILLSSLLLRVQSDENANGTTSPEEYEHGSGEGLPRLLEPSTMESRIHARVGQDVLLQCRFSNILISKRPLWQKDYMPVKSENGRIRRVSEGLLLTNARLEDSGYYTCAGGMKLNNVETRSFYLTVHEKPKLMNGPKDTVTIEGNDIILPCEVDLKSSQGHLRQIWRRSSMALPYGRCEVLNNGSLILYSVMPRDSGIYICQVITFGGETEIQIRLNVLRKHPREKREHDVADCEETFPHFVSAFSILVEALGTSIEKHSNNSIYSPLAVFNSLFMLYKGSAGETKNLIERTLNLPADITNTIFRQWRHCLGVHHLPHIKLRMSSAIFVQNDVIINENFTDWLSLDKTLGLFEGELADAVPKINQYISHKTDGLIENLLSSHDIDPLLRMLLLSVVYFKGSWSVAFDPKRTIRDKFYSRSGTSEISMMQMELKARHFRKDGFGECLELPFGTSDAIALYIYLPAIDPYGDNPEDPSESLKSSVMLRQFYDLINREISNLHEVPVDLKLPKVTLDSGSISLRDAITDLGLGKLFTEPDLTGMIVGETDLHVSKVLHRSLLKLQEEGAEAASASSIHVSARSRPSPKVPFYVNRPFCLLLLHRKTMTPIIAAHVSSLSDESAGSEKGSGMQPPIPRVDPEEDWEIGSGSSMDTNASASTTAATHSQGNFPPVTAGHKKKLKPTRERMTVLGENHDTMTTVALNAIPDPENAVQQRQSEDLTQIREKIKKLKPKIES